MKMYNIGLTAVVVLVVVCSVIRGSLTMNMAQINSHDGNEEISTIETQPLFHQSDNGDNDEDDDGDNPCSPLDTNAPTNYMTSSFYYSSICILKDEQITPECNENGSNRTLLVLSRTKWSALRSDLHRHQHEFKTNHIDDIDDSNVHFYSDDTYPHLVCMYHEGKLVGNNYFEDWYIRYTVVHYRTSSLIDVFQMDHVCSPVQKRPGFSSSGPC